MYLRCTCVYVPSTTMGEVVFCDLYYSQPLGGNEDVLASLLVSCHAVNLFTVNGLQVNMYSVCEWYSGI